ncbi:MAG TPA: PIG-L family deacetylase [Chitinophagaceae bacterium]
MKKFLLVLIAYCQLPVGHSQAPQSWTSADMYLALRKLNVLGSVLYVAAHPDDENTRLITYLSKDKLYRAGYLSMTRGDGGQNLIGDEQGIELGLIRTQELLSARRIDGGEQFFTRAYDFGYSKTPEETFSKWDKEKILSDVVWVIRKFQPDVVITRFPQTGEGGHGHHTASAILANEAFSAAADPTRFPEQLNYVQTWQVKRVLWNTFNFGGNNTTREDQFKIDVGGYNPLLGKSYGEIAAESRSQHKSQGFGVPASRGEALEYFRATKGDQPLNDLMEGVELSWKKINGGQTIQTIIDSLVSSFDLFHPENSVQGLVRLYKAIKILPEGYWKMQKLREVQQLIAQCSGLFIDATASEQFAVQTDSVRINFSFNNRLGTEASLQRVRLDEFDTTISRTLEKNRNLNFSQTIYVPADKKITQPYWLENKMEEGYFNVPDKLQIGQPDVDPAYEALVQVIIFGERFIFVRPVKYKFTDPVKGEIYWPLVVMPSYTLKVDPEFAVWKQNKNEPYFASYEKRFTSYRLNNSIRTVQEHKNPDGKTRGYESIDSLILGKQMRIVEVKEQTFSGDPMYDLKDGKMMLSPLFPRKSKEFLDKNSKQPVYDVLFIKHDHIPAITYFKPSKIIIEDIRTAIHNKKIGYIIGAGDKVPESLEQMGYEVTLLTDKELSRNNLQQFDAIITGVRAHNTNAWMNNHYDKLMKYVNNGGNLIVQYNTSSNIGPVRAKMGPYNFNISRTRITDENAPVTFLKPEHPVFNFPNKITQEDFKGWIQERSIYHAAAWDSTKFETVLSMNDPGEKPDAGSLIIAKHGKGVFVYTGIVFFRELPAGVPGAYRLLANIIALNRKKGF